MQYQGPKRQRVLGLLSDVSIESMLKALMEDVQMHLLAFDKWSESD